MEVAAPLVKYQALVYASPFIRELELGQSYKELLKQALEATLNANEELEYSNQSMQMQFK